MKVEQRQKLREEQNMVWRVEVGGKKFYHRTVPTRGAAEGLRNKLKLSYDEVKTQKTTTGKYLVLWRGRK